MLTREQIEELVDKALTVLCFETDPEKKVALEAFIDEMVVLCPAPPAPPSKTKQVLILGVAAVSTAVVVALIYTLRGKIKDISNEEFSRKVKAEIMKYLEDDYNKRTGGNQFQDTFEEHA